uniref:NifU-like protein c n=1 Tax=Kwoniella bestiolae CBS 10118 TaxID=1296100 RepID=A0A1B9FYB9_9TREE|nr:NifU-like protein c [Kwoniella bestiolae CBS 10118]OCF23750.1 NifU-like protein c [Kwoniella bestiolae CBS 10118]
MSRSSPALRPLIASSSRTPLKIAPTVIRSFASSSKCGIAVSSSASFVGVGLSRGEIRRKDVALGGGRQQRRTMFIQTETTPNEASLKFIPGVPVTNGGTHEFLDLRSALSSPLATRLLGIDGVTGIFFGPDFVTCSKDDSFNWSILKPEIFAILMEHFSSGASLFKEGHSADQAEDTKILDTDSEIVGMIKELLETRVRPAIQEDGGDIEYKGFEEDSGIVKLKLKGSCRGCSSSSVTLKNGIERMLMHYVPEVQSVEQVLDEEELIALEEFSKLEARLEKQKGKDGKPE